MSAPPLGGPGDDIPQSSDTAFVLRLPNSLADKVRAMIAANNFQGLELNIDRERDGAKKDFGGRTGHFKLGAGTPEQISLPASLMNLPTVCYPPLLPFPPPSPPSPPLVVSNSPLPTCMHSSRVRPEPTHPRPHLLPPTPDHT